MLMGAYVPSAFSVLGLHLLDYQVAGVSLQYITTLGLEMWWCLSSSTARMSRPSSSGEEVCVETLLMCLNGSWAYGQRWHVDCRLS
jgi:hypothetical protein